MRSCSPAARTRSLARSNWFCDSVTPTQRAPKLLRRAQHQRAPAAADVQQALARLQPDLAQDVVDLLHLRLVQRLVALLEVGARIDHALAQPLGGRSRWTRRSGTGWLRCRSSRVWPKRRRMRPEQTRLRARRWPPARAPPPRCPARTRPHRPGPRHRPGPGCPARGRSAAARPQRRAPWTLHTSALESRPAPATKHRPPPQLRRTGTLASPALRSRPRQQCALHDRIPWQDASMRDQPLGL